MKNTIIITMLSFLFSGIFIDYPSKTIFSLELFLILASFFIEEVRVVLFSIISGFLLSEVLYRTLNNIKYGYHNLAFEVSFTDSHFMAFVWSLPIVLIALALLFASLKRI